MPKTIEILDNYVRNIRGFEYLISIGTPQDFLNQKWYSEEEILKVLNKNWMGLGDMTREMILEELGLKR